MFFNSSTVFSHLGTPCNYPSFAEKHSVLTFKSGLFFLIINKKQEKLAKNPHEHLNVKLHSNKVHNQKAGRRENLALFIKDIAKHTDAVNAVCIDNLV